VDTGILGERIHPFYGYNLMAKKSDTIWGVVGLIVAVVVFGYLVIAVETNSALGGFVDGIQEGIS
jgi:hypothetical protein